MDRKHARAEAARLYRQGIKPAEIGEKLAAMGFVSKRTKGPLSVNGVYGLISRSRILRSVDGGSRNGANEPAETLALVQMVAEDSKMADSKKVRVIQALVR